MLRSFLEGIIGAGKSSLLHCLQQEHGFTVLPESVDTAGTFRDAVIHGVPFQLNIAAMLDLLRRLRRAIAQAPSTELTRTVVLERGLLGSTAFVELAAANNTMTALEVGLCKELLREIHVVIDQAVSDGIVEKVTTVYLRIQTDTALARVRLRKRSGEEWISAAYLQALQAQHDALMRRNDANPPHRDTLVTTVADIETESASALAAQLAKTLSFTRRFHSILRLENEVSAVCSTALKANTLMSVMPSMVAAKSAVYYLAKYFKKDSCTPKDLLILYHKAKILQERYPSTVTWTWEYNRIYLTTY